MDEKWLAYNEPYWTDEEPYCNTVRCITEKNAILYIKRSFPETSFDDSVALDTFIAAHWAWYIKSPPVADKVSL